MLSIAHVLEKVLIGDLVSVSPASGSGYKAPEEMLKEMPLNATGKVDRVALKRMAEEQHKN